MFAYANIDTRPVNRPTFAYANMIAGSVGVLPGIVQLLLRTKIITVLESEKYADNYWISTHPGK